MSAPDLVRTDDPASWPDWLTSGYALLLAKHPREGRRLEIRCKHCESGWAYPYGRAMGGAALLQLLDHARSHDEQVQS